MALIGRYYFEVKNAKAKECYVILEAVGSGSLTTLLLQPGNKIIAINPDNTPEGLTERAFKALNG